jgi:hypothetical protein
MAPQQTPAPGRIVHYRLTATDVAAINVRRANGTDVGNSVQEGQHPPAIVTAFWPNEFGDQPGINAQVFLDGNDSLWVTSKKEGDSNGEWT